MNSYDERTPLLDRLDNGQVLPAILPVLARVYVSPEQGIPSDGLLPYPLSDQFIEMAFTLAVLLQIRHVKMQSFNSVGAYERWFQKNLDTDGIETLEKQIIRVWTQFLDQYRDVREVETVLWTQFPLETGGLKAVRVADFLGSFPALASHPIIMLSLSHTWYHGVPPHPWTTNNSPLTWIRRYDALCKPWACHCIELISHMAYLVLLVHYLLDPPNRPHTSDNRFDSLGWRELLLIFAPLSFVHRSRPFPNTIPLLVPFAFLISFPSVPLPGSAAFGVLLWAFVLYILRLHLPCAPSPLFLLLHHRTLPLASFLSHGLFRMIFPSVLFFFPVLMLASFLLSLSMADMLLKVFVLIVHVPSPSPMETRITFLFLFAGSPVLLIFSTFLLPTTLFPSQKNMDPWDQYSEEVGHMARTALIDAIAPYTGLYRFPPPFNAIHLLINIPRSALGVGATWGSVAEKALWRTTVGPFMVVFAVLPQRRVSC